MTIYLYALTCICSFKVCAILYYQCIYILNGTCVVVMHVQLQLCIIETSNLYNSYSYCILYPILLLSCHFKEAQMLQTVQSCLL